MNTTRRHPRTLQDAFGPYTDHHIYETREPSRWAALAYGVTLVLCCIAIGAMCALGTRA